MSKILDFKSKTVLYISSDLQIQIPIKKQASSNTIFNKCK